MTRDESPVDATARLSQISSEATSKDNYDAIAEIYIKKCLQVSKSRIHIVRVLRRAV